jgi:hypothetical protein
MSVYCVCVSCITGLLLQYCEEIVSSVYLFGRGLTHVLETSRKFPYLTILFKRILVCHPTLVSTELTLICKNTCMDGDAHTEKMILHMTGLLLCRPGTRPCAASFTAYLTLALSLSALKEERFRSAGSFGCAPGPDRSLSNKSHCDELCMQPFGQLTGRRAVGVDTSPAVLVSSQSCPLTPTVNKTCVRVWCRRLLPSSAANSSRRVLLGLTSAAAKCAARVCSKRVSL